MKVSQYYQTVISNSDNEQALQITVIPASYFSTPITLTNEDLENSGSSQKGYLRESSIVEVLKIESPILLPL